MHELALCHEVVRMCQERAAGRKVRKVSLEVGKLSCVQPRALAFCFEVCVESTLLEGATLEIKETPGRGRCRSCGEELEMEQLVAQCACGGLNIEVISGEQFLVTSMEVT